MPKILQKSLNCHPCFYLQGGDIILWDTNQSTSDLENRRTLFKSMIQGRGPGGSIQCLKFDIENPERVFTASIDGTVTRHNFNGDDNKIYLGEYSTVL